MSSGSGIGAIAGLAVAAIGAYFTGGATLAAYGAAFASYAGAAISVGAAIGGMLYPSKGPENNGPRLSDLTVQTSTYGAFIPRAYSTIAMSGNLFWLENGQLKEVAKKASSGGKGGMMGGGGSGQKTYSYYATFALGLCDCSNDRPIIGIRRLWIGPKLFYDAGSDDYDTLIKSNQNAEGFQLYLGTDTQLADTRMEATLGAGNVPGYRGLAYIVFYDLPLADYGNSLVVAQIKAEVVTSGTKGYIFDKNSTTAVNEGVNGVSVSNGYAYVISTGDIFPGAIPPKIEIYDVNDIANPVFIGSVTTELYAQSLVVNGLYLYLATSGNNSLQIYSIANPANPTLVGSVALIYRSTSIAINDQATYAYVTQSDDSSSVQMIDISVKTAPVVVGLFATDQLPIGMIAYNDLIYVMNYVGDTSQGTIQIFDLSTVEFGAEVGSIDIIMNPSGFAIANDYMYIVGVNNNLYIYSLATPESPALVSTTVINGSISTLGKSISVSGDYACITSPADNDIHVWNISNPLTPIYVGAQSATGGLYTITGLQFIDNYIYLTNGGDENKLEIYTFIDGTIQSATVPLSDIVEAEIINSELLTSADVDVSLLTSPVRGYRIASIGSIRGGIEPLQGAWPFDVIQHGYQIKCVPRGGSSIATITDDLLDARTSDSQSGVIITNSREMDSILPQKVSVKYFDIEREYDEGEQYAERINTDAVNISSLDMSIVFNPTEAAGKAQVLLYLYWMERYDIAFSLPPEYNYLEPSDVITITSDNATYNLRIVSINYASDGKLEIGAKYNDAAIYTPTAIGEGGVFTGQTLTLQGDTLYELLDIPMIQDVYDSSGFPVAMAGYKSGWSGATLFRTVDNGQNWDDIQGFVSPGSVIGYASDTLGVHGGTVLDKSGVLTAHMYQSTLSSVTEAQMFAGANWFAYGTDERWEIIAAQKCVLQADGTYILTDFLRGQFGTEWATGLHEIGDSIVHLSSSGLAWVSMNQSYIGIEAEYRGITSGSLIDSDTDRAFTYRGVNLECLSPCHSTGSRHPSTNDWTITWTRRTRYAGWRSYVDASLGETTESYEVDIYSDNTYTTIKRTLTSTSSTVQYTSAQQVTDFGGNQTTLYLKIYQLSAIVGRGYPLTVSLTR